MAREWQPGSRSERAASAPGPPYTAASDTAASADDARARDETPPGSATDSVTGPVAPSEPGRAKGPGGTTGWLPEQDFLRRSRGPAEDHIDPEAVTRQQPAFGTRDTGLRTGPAPAGRNVGPPGPDNEEPYTGASEENTASFVPAGGPEGAGADPGGEPGNRTPVAGEESPEPSGHGEAIVDAQQPPETSRWRRFVGRTTGGGPLSAGRVAQERAQQTPPGGNGSQGDPAPAKDPRHRQDPDLLEPGGTMDPNERVKRIAQQISRGDRDPHTAERYAEEEEEEAAREGLARGGPLVWLIDHWKVIAVPVAALCMITFVLATVGLPDLGGSSGEVASSRGAAGESPGEDGEGGTSGPQGSESAPLYDSGLSFSFSEKEDGTVELSAGEDLTWSGRIERVSKEEAPKQEDENDPREGAQGSAAEAAVEVLRFSGPTAAEVGPGYTMDPDSENPGQTSTTVFAVEGEGVPDVHATFHLFVGSSGEGDTQRANGSYDVTADSGELIAEGTYSDHRTGASGGREVIRTYTEQVPGESGSRQFRVRYEADKGTPVPLLAGWQTPDERPEDLKLEGEV